MNNDKAFAIYAFGLVSIIGMAIMIAVSGGIAAVPSVAFIVEHTLLGIGIRAAYKSFDGSNPIVDFLEYYGWKTPVGLEVPGAAPAAA